jgi:hypothetical protein
MYKPLLFIILLLASCNVLYPRKTKQTPCYAQVKPILDSIYKLRFNETNWSILGIHHSDSEITYKTSSSAGFIIKCTVLNDCSIKRITYSLGTIETSKDLP